MARHRATPHSCSKKGISSAPRIASCGRFLAMLALLLAMLGPAAQAEDARIAAARKTERKTFTDSEIADGFFKTTFGAELNLVASSDRIRKFDGPVRVYVENRARPNRRGDVARVIADIGSRVRNLDIAITERREDAQLVVTLVRNRDLNRTIRSIFGREQARRILRDLDPQCLSGFSKDENYRILRADVLLVADAGEFIFYDCAYEELLQALGPLNDTGSVRWTMFNDDVQMGFFGVYDQYILNILYDPRIRPGMKHEEVRAIFPDVLKSVRPFVAQRNGLNPN